MAAEKCFIVTGAGGGLGGSTADMLAARGANVIAVDLDESGLKKLAARTSDHPGEVVTKVADVSDEEAVKALVEEAKSRWGRLDGIFNNAAIEGAVAPITDYSTAEFDRVQRVNVRSVFLGMKYAIPALLDGGGGAILSTSSTGGMMGWPELTGYVASKHAVIGLSRAVALEMAGKNVRVNVIAPGPMDTRMIWALGEHMAPGDKAKQQKMLEGTIPVGRFGRPEEVAAVAAWLLLEGPEYLTGAVIPVDGAQTAG